MTHYVTPKSNRALIVAQTTLGSDDAAFVMRYKNNPKAQPIKAIFGKKHIRFKRPILQWEQKYKEVIRI